MPNFCIRTDASLDLGTGHAMRCLTLADGLRAANARVVFVCRTLPGDLCDFIAGNGYEVRRLPAERDGQTVDWQQDAVETMAALAGSEPFDWLIVDHYGLDARWEARLRKSTRQLMAIDDLADRPHDCDLLLDQNYYRNMESRYDGLVADDCRRFLGPDYALLRPEFLHARRRLRQRDGCVRRILILMGGADPQNVTSRVIEAVQMGDYSHIGVDVVIGAANPHRQQVATLCGRQPNFRLHVQAANIAALLAEADLGIGAGGATTWERCALGLPTLSMVLAANQEQTTRDLADAGVIRYLGWAERLTVADLAAAIDEAIRHPDDLAAMGRRALQLMAGFARNDPLPVVAALLGHVAAGAIGA